MSFCATCTLNRVYSRTAVFDGLPTCLWNLSFKKTFPELSLWCCPLSAFKRCSKEIEEDFFKTLIFKIHSKGL